MSSCKSLIEVYAWALRIPMRGYEFAPFPVQVRPNKRYESP